MCDGCDLIGYMSTSTSLSHTLALLGYVLGLLTWIDTRALTYLVIPLRGTISTISIAVGVIAPLCLHRLPT